MKGKQTKPLGKWTACSEETKSSYLEVWSDHFFVGIVWQRRPCITKDLAVFGQKLFGVKSTQRGVRLPLGQVSGRSKNSNHERAVFLSKLQCTVWDLDSQRGRSHASVHSSPLLNLFLLIFFPPGIAALLLQSHHARSLGTNSASAFEHFVKILLIRRRKARRRRREKREMFRFFKQTGHTWFQRFVSFRGSWYVLFEILFETEHQIQILYAF